MEARRVSLDARHPASGVFVSEAGELAKQVEIPRQHEAFLLKQ